MTRMINILTIDVEDYFQVENFKKVIRFSDWGGYELRAVRNTEKILDILANKNVKATFFVLGWLAERAPQLVKKIHQAGHEIASHGYAHNMVCAQTPDEFRQDLRKAKKILEDIIQEPVLGYRAPTYSITKDSLWALDILREEGLKYDSSLFPARRAKGGFAQAGRYPYKIYNGQDFIWEFPISTVRILNKTIAFSGGGYFRLFPYKFIKSSIESVNKEGHPAIIYIHPWELDPQQPRIKADFIGRFKHYVNISKTEGKFKRLLDDFKFGMVREFLGK